VPSSLEAIDPTAAGRIVLPRGIALEYQNPAIYIAPPGATRGNAVQETDGGVRTTAHHKQTLFEMG